ncbi:hypothetical protein P7K49_030962 [Saguinus oedipus]|uniref:Uncharacterized protein n=1 Tax=Saguinus oedipus TaxID=9490 RepID=A0ABQ9U3N4_SAGOE|nr:hypothetical protein P7K49_030962 [Saguinus oedipus]
MRNVPADIGASCQPRGEASVKGEADLRGGRLREETEWEQSTQGGRPERDVNPAVFQHKTQVILEEWPEVSGPQMVSGEALTLTGPVDNAWGRGRHREVSLDCSPQPRSCLVSTAHPMCIQGLQAVQNLNNPVQKRRGTLTGMCRLGIQEKQA